MERIRWTSSFSCVALIHWACANRPYRDGLRGGQDAKWRMLPENSLTPCSPSKQVLFCTARLADDGDRIVDKRLEHLSQRLIRNCSP